MSLMVTRVDLGITKNPFNQQSKGHKASASAPSRSCWIRAAIVTFSIDARWASLLGRIAGSPSITPGGKLSSRDEDWW